MKRRSFLQAVAALVALPGVVKAKIFKPASDAEAIDLGEDTWFWKRTPKALYVGEPGDVVMMVDGKWFTLREVPGGTVIPVRLDGIDKATTAGNLVAMY